MSPIQYLKKLRLEKAKDLLENSFLQINQIGNQVGIADRSHFVREFKERYGVTPTEYRKQHWAETEIEDLPANE